MGYFVKYFSCFDTFISFLALLVMHAFSNYIGISKKKQTQGEYLSHYNPWTKINITFTINFRSRHLILKAKTVCNVDAHFLRLQQLDVTSNITIKNILKWLSCKIVLLFFLKLIIFKRILTNLKQVSRLSPGLLGQWPSEN